MLINTYVNNSEVNRVTKDLTAVINYDVKFLNGSDFLNPNLLLNIETLKPDFNYIYIPDFKRYYFVRNIQNVSFNMWSIECEIDVLMSYDYEIRNQNAIIARQNNAVNLLVPDTFFPFRADTDTVNKLFSSGFSPNGFFCLLASGG